MVENYHHVKHCTTHPKFLHSNSTSHRWVFGAMAELIDNAIDPDVNASQFCIDMKEFDGEPCLVFMDNGSGLEAGKLLKMLSFGHSRKQMNPGDRSIGQHGNGFKSGTMRLGKDVLVLTKCSSSMTAGFLSQTFLADTNAEDILIPLISWDKKGNRLSTVDLEVEESLKAICKYSIFPDEESILAQFEAIPHTGAILFISNLRRHEGILELDFETDTHDIRISSEIASATHFQQLRPSQPNTTVVPMDYSLRAYVSILYKVPRMQIFIRDKKVKMKRIAGLLSQKETEVYRPYGVAESVKIEIGFNTENKTLYGMMLYHRNRLIKAYMRVGIQLEENEKGMGVIGLAEADFLQPTHNKQDFDDTTAYRRLLKKLADVLGEYWWEKKERANALTAQPDTRRRTSAQSPHDDVPDTNWVQCDNPTCLKWRVLPPGTSVEKLPDVWYCEYHPDPKYRRHDEPEQEWDTTVHHEITDRRRERKREYDRERKERELQRKRQRLEAATRESVALLEKQKEQIAKGIEEQLVKEKQVVEERRRREEEVKTLNEEWVSMKAECARMEQKREEMRKEQEELVRQMSAAQEELARQAREKEELALLEAQKETERAAQVERERLALIEAQKSIERERIALVEAQKQAELEARKSSEQETRNEVPEANSNLRSQNQRFSEENAHISELTIDETTPLFSSGSPQGRQKASRRKSTRAYSKKTGSLMIISERPLVQEPNGTCQDLGPGMDVMGNLELAQSAGNEESPGPHQSQRSLSSGHCIRSVRTVSAATEQDSARNPKNRRGASGRSRRQGKPVEVVQPERRRLKDLNQVSQTAAVPCNEPQLDTPPSAQSSPPEPIRIGQLAAPTSTPTRNLQTCVEVCHSSVDQRSSSVSDTVHRVTGSDDVMTGSLVSTGKHVTNVAVTDAIFASTPVWTCLRPEGRQGQPTINAQESGGLCVDLHMEPSTCRPKSMETLDREFYTSQRHLKLALNTLLKMVGCDDGRVYDLDQMPVTDEEVIQLCNKVGGGWKPWHC